MDKKLRAQFHVHYYLWWAEEKLYFCFKSDRNALLVLFYNILEESAGHELAWRNAGQKPGVQIWRIVVSMQISIVFTSHVCVVKGTFILQKELI